MSSPSPRHPRPAAFLDRDGVLNLDTGYPYRVEELILTPTAAAGVRRLNLENHWVLVVTNQSGVARGLFGLAEVERFNTAIQQRLSEAGAHIDAFYVAPYHPDGTVAPFNVAHEDRKPGTGMFDRAMRDYPVVRQRSFMIGDKASDVEAAQRAGIRAVRVATNECDLDATVAAELGRLGGDRVPSPHFD